MNSNDTLVRRIQIALIGLIGFDLVLSVWAWFFPGLWFTVFHGVPYDDPQGFLRRCAANWTAFLLFQIVAYFKWKKAPYWLVLVAGVRLSDIFTDWTYLLFCADITIHGGIMLFLASPMNMVFGAYLLYAYKKITDGRSLNERSDQTN